jgi:hypothetical protein
VAPALLPPQVRQHLYLVAVGVEEPGASSATLKVWDGAKLAALKPPPAATSAAGGAAAGGAPGPAPPAPLKVQRLFGPKWPEGEPTARAATDAAAPSLTVAVGLSTGFVYIFQVRGPAAGPRGHRFGLYCCGCRPAIAAGPRGVAAAGGPLLQQPGA